MGRRGLLHLAHCLILAVFVAGLLTLVIPVSVVRGGPNTLTVVSLVGDSVSTAPAGPFVSATTAYRGTQPDGGLPQYPHIEGAYWIWMDGFVGDLAHPLYFLKTFSIPDGSVGIKGTIRITADNFFNLSINGVNYGGTAPPDTEQWRNLHAFPVTNLSPGENRISITAWEGVPGTPSGLVYELTVEMSGPPPNQPTNVSPANTASEVSLTPTLEASDFSDPDAGDSQVAAQWQVTSVSGDYSSPVYDSGSDNINLTEIALPSRIISESTTYYWRVRYQDSSGNWSEWSVETSFSNVRDSFTSSVPLPGDVSTDPKVITISGILAFILVLVFYFSATLFNSTVKENHDVVEGWLARGARRLKLVGQATDKVRSAASKMVPARGSRYLPWIAVVAVCALIYWFLDPYFNSRLHGISLFFAMFIGIGVVTCAYEGSQFLLTRDGFDVPAMMKIYWIAIPIAAACVIFSNVIDFHPGMVYGFVGGYVALSGTKTLEKRRQALVILFGSAVLLAIALTAFLLRGVVHNAGGEGGGFWVTFADEILVAVFVIGLEGLAFALVPLTFMDGAKIMAWKPLVWGVLTLVVGFVFYYIIIVKEANLTDAVQNPNVIMMLSLMVVFWVISSGIWVLFRIRHKRLQQQEEMQPVLAAKGIVADTVPLRAEGASGQRSALEEVVQVMSARMEKKDPHTASHQRRVADLAHAMAAELGLAGEQSATVRLAGMLHDMGKMLVPSEILNKPGRLTPAEFVAVRTHPRSGSQMLKDEQVPAPIADIVAQHHERMDGSGYPSGLTGDQSSLEARILAVADVVEAMTSERPHRPGFSLEKALEEISSKKGKLYDPSVVDACLSLFKKGSFRFAEPST
jgi:putative nucleotidyltransferase with HDIG domain